MSREQQEEFTRARLEAHEKLVAMYRDAEASGDEEMKTACMAAMEKNVREVAETVDWHAAKKAVHLLMRAMVQLRLGKVCNWKLAELEEAQEEKQRAKEVAKAIRVYHVPTPTPPQLPAAVAPPPLPTTL